MTLSIVDIGQEEFMVTLKMEFLKIPVIWEHVIRKFYYFQQVMLMVRMKQFIAQFFSNKKVSAAMVKLKKTKPGQMIC
jgi:hypothetical protein